MTTRKIKKFIGGSKIRDVDQTIDIVKINDSFCQLFLFFLQTQNLQYEKTKISTDKKYIYTGFIDPITHIIFGSSDIKDKPTTLIQVTIDDTPLNRQLVNQFKLHMMSIMANYTLQGGTTLYERINPLLNPLKITDIMKVLEINEDVKASVVAPPVAPLQNEDMLELMIYKEFGVNCPPQIGGGKFSGICINKYDSLYYPKLSLNHTSLNGINYDKLPNYTKSLIRDIYVNLFNVITGISAGQTKCLLIYNGFKFIKQITPDIFYGFITNKPFKFKDIIKHVNIIRERIDRHYCGLNGIRYDDYIAQNDSNLLKNESEWP